MFVSIDNPYLVAGRWSFTVQVDLASILDLLVATKQPGEVLPWIAPLVGNSGVVNYYLVNGSTKYQIANALEQALEVALVAARDGLSLLSDDVADRAEVEPAQVRWADAVNKERFGTWADAVAFFDVVYGTQHPAHLPSVLEEVVLEDSHRAD
jgi:hypothetical protein